MPIKSFKDFLELIKKNKSRKSRFQWSLKDLEMHDNPKDRQNNFSWTSDDIEIHPNKKINEDTHTKIEHKTDGTYENPHQDENPDYNEKINEDEKKKIKISKENFAKHGKTLSNKHISHIMDYKSSSNDLNNHLRNKKDYHSPSKIKQLDHVTSHKIDHNVTVYRGVHPDFVHNNHHKMQSGSEFTDHGYTGTSYKRHIAAGFSQYDHGKGKQLLFKIHLKPGDKAHHLDSTSHNQEHSFSNEDEVLLHRGTRFKISHHSEDKYHHYINLHIVHQPDYKGEKYSEKHDHDYHLKHVPGERPHHQLPNSRETIPGERDYKSHSRSRGKIHNDYHERVNKTKFGTAHYGNDYDEKEWKDKLNPNKNPESFKYKQKHDPRQNPDHWKNKKKEEEKQIKQKNELKEKHKDHPIHTVAKVKAKKNGEPIHVLEDKKGGLTTYKSSVWNSMSGKSKANYKHVHTHEP